MPRVSWPAVPDRPRRSDAGRWQATRVRPPRHATQGCPSSDPVPTLARALVGALPTSTTVVLLLTPEPTRHQTRNQPSRNALPHSPRQAPVRSSTELGARPWPSPIRLRRQAPSCPWPSATAQGPHHRWLEGDLHSPRAAQRARRRHHLYPFSREARRSLFRRRVTRPRL